MQAVLKVLLVILIFLYSSCKSGNNAVSKNFIQIISDSSSFEGVKNYANCLNFSRIDKGSDSFELRLWSSLVMTNLRLVSILKFSNSVWRLSETTFWVKYVTDNPNGILIELDSSVTKKKEPTIAFSKIIDSVNYFKIQAVPSQREIPNFVNRTADGISYTLEIATKDYYKIISYHNPRYYDDSSHRKWLDILSFFQRNLGAFAGNY